MAYDKNAIKATIAISADDRDAILAAGGLRGMTWFRSLWPFGVTTSTGDPTLATMVQTYDTSLATDAQIQAILQPSTVRASNLNQITVALAGV